LQIFSARHVSPLQPHGHAMSWATQAPALQVYTARTTPSHVVVPHELIG
jgi:hypothetical protein